MEQIAQKSKEAFSPIREWLKSQKETIGGIISARYFNLALSLIILLYMGRWVSHHFEINAEEPQLTHELFITQQLIKLSCYLTAIVVWMLLVTLFGELMPNRNKNSHKLEQFIRQSGEMNLIIKVFSPFSWLIVNTTKIADKRLEVKAEHRLSIDELSETLKTEKIQANAEKEILQSIVTFGNISVDEIMRPRVDIVDLDITYSYGKVLSIIKESEYSRLPVYEDTIDNVKGILYVKDLLDHTEEGNEFKWQELMRKPYFVPESKKIDELLKEFQSKHIHMAIVVDEFGGTSGIVTLENILEVIVGDISDEHDEEQKLFTELDAHNFILEAKLPLSDFFKIKKVEKEDFTKYINDADTLAGLLLEIKGDIPKAGEKIEVGQYLFQIISADNRRIKKVKMHIERD
ncbi:MAG: CBS domain-containing protein [Paludibacteraceae bacterium]|nr:CBS domain-containing protein [Paludibacteraceae bacterium]